jgi:hypothetical protein
MVKSRETASRDGSGHGDGGELTTSYKLDNSMRAKQLIIGVPTLPVSTIFQKCKRSAGRIIAFQRHEPWNENGGGERMKVNKEWEMCRSISLCWLSGLAFHSGTSPHTTN